MHTQQEKITARPILFTPDMVRAILDRRKTQTRRIIKLRDGSLPDDDSISTHLDGTFDKVMDFSKTFPHWQELKCPYGTPGDHLWVRETYLQWQYRDGEKGEIAYLDDPNIEALKRDMENLKKQKNTGNWRVIPSIHMPRAASRILLEITHIRAQRLHDITEADAIAEGIHYTTPNSGPNRYYDNYHTGRWMEAEMLNNPIASYRTLWETINGPHSWEQNPWVWAITFKNLASPNPASGIS